MFKFWKKQKDEDILNSEGRGLKLKNYVGKCTEGDQCGYKSCLKSPCTLWNTCSITGFKSTTGRFKNMLNTAVKICKFHQNKAFTNTYVSEVV